MATEGNDEDRIRPSRLSAFGEMLRLPASQIIRFLRSGIRFYAVRRHALPACPDHCFPFHKALQKGRGSMTAKPDILRIEVLPPVGRPGSPERAEQAIRALARIIGRQIAREQFREQVAEERRATNSHPTSRDPDQA